MALCTLFSLCLCVEKMPSILGGLIYIETGRIISA